MSKPAELIAILIVCSAVLLLGASSAPAQAPEMRAMWASRFDWPHTDPATCRTRIDDLMQDLADANFNAVFFQIRGQADVFYPSPYETWSPILGETDPGWDPLAYAVAAAHAHGLEFHAYINTHTCWQSAPASAHTLPANPNHTFYSHCNLTDPAHRDWLHHVSASNPVQFSESDYVWFAPGVPDYQAYTRQQVLYVVTHYAVDGVHFDRIRTPWSNEPSYDPISLARFNNAQTNPDGLAFGPWTADQINRLVRDIYADIMAVRPDVKVSAAVYSNPATAPSAQHQDALRWANDGAMDILVPMMYFTGGAGSTWDTRLQAWLAGSGGRQVVAGQITSQGSASLLDQIALTRLRGGQGNNVFSWGSFTFWNNYLAGPYATPVSPPDMTWKDNPVTGIIYGYVTNAQATPVVDAQITYPGAAYTALSTGDGFYSFLLVPPATYDLTATHPGYSTAIASGVSVAAGSVVRRDIVLGTPVPPVITEVTPDPDAGMEGQAYTRQLLLSQGTADSWTMLAGPSGATVSAGGFVSGWTPTSTDVGRTVTFTVRATNTGGSDEESWGVAVAGIPPCTPFKITNFDDAAVGSRILFRNPRFSGSTSGDLKSTPDVAVVTDAVDAFSPPQAFEIQWEYLDTDPQRWMRLTTNNAVGIPNPTVELDRPIRVRLRLDAGRLRLCVGIRETGTTAAVGADGGTSGTIEWVGAATDLNGAPQGVPVEPMPGIWQTFVFDPLTAPLRGMTGDGLLWTATNKGVFEHLAFSVVDGTGPFTVYIDDIDLLCGLPDSGDIDGDGDVDLADYARWADCLGGPEQPNPGCPAADFTAADFDGDGDVDLADGGAFQAAYAPVP